MLYDAFPNETEGELSRRLAALVRKETCAEVAAAAWGVGPAMRLGEGEAQSGGRGKRALLGDICEAIIGATFLDGGAIAAERIVRKAFSERMGASGQIVANAKTALQEWAQAGLGDAPLAIVMVRSRPDHAPLFEVAVDIKGFDLTPGSGASKRAAEQAAAAAFLAREDAAAGKRERQRRIGARTNALRLCGARRRAERRQVDAAQQLVGAKVSIVSRKAQTTRALVRGIAIDGAAQIILVDTPGIFKPKRRLDRAMVASALSGAADADVIALLVDSRKGLDEEVEAILTQLQQARAPKLLVLNKIDPHRRRPAFARADAQRQGRPSTKPS